MLLVGAGQGNQMASLRFRVELEGLRGVLIFLIAFYHAGASLFASSFFSVDAFFVVSGYLMAAIILADLDAGRFSLLDFYERRARRLLPTLYVVLLAGVVLAYFILPPIDYETLAESAIWSLAMVGNVFFADAGPGYFSASISLQPFMHIWSLSLEQQYYVLIPLIFAVFSSVRRYWLPCVMLGLSAASLSLAFSMASSGDGARAYYVFTARAWEFLFGGLAAMYQAPLRELFPLAARRWLSDVGLALLLGVCFFASEHSLHPGWMTLLPVAGVLMLLVYATPDSFAVRFLSWAPLVWLGGLSYSLYLWHQVLLAFGRWVFIDNFDLLIAATLLVAAVGLSVITCKFVEEPFRSAKRVSRARFAGGLLCSTVLVFSVANYVDNKHGLRHRLPVAYVEETLERSGLSYSITQDGVDCQAKIEAGEACEIGDPNAERSWALIGDSHASQLASSMDALFRKAGVAGYLVARYTCGYAIGARLVGDHGGHCEKHNERVQDWLLGNATINNIVIAERGSYYYSKSRYDNGSGASESGQKYWFEPKQSLSGEAFEVAVLRSMMLPIQTLLDAGKQVVLVYPTPEFGWDVPRYFFRQVMRGQEVIDIAFDAKIYDQRTAPFRRAVAKSIGAQPNLTVVDPKTIFCDEQRCKAYQNGRLLYRDDDHLTRYGTDRLVERIGEAAGLDSLSNRIVTRF